MGLVEECSEAGGLFVQEPLARQTRGEQAVGERLEQAYVGQDVEERLLTVKQVPEVLTVTNRSWEVEQHAAAEQAARLVVTARTWRATMVGHVPAMQAGHVPATRAGCVLVLADDLQAVEAGVPAAQ